MTLGSFKKLQADDWTMISVLIPFTALIVLANQSCDSTTTHERKSRFAMENVQIITVWLVKACLLILYWRILYDLPAICLLKKLRNLQSGWNKYMETKSLTRYRSTLLHLLLYHTNLIIGMVPTPLPELGNEYITT